MAELGTRWSDRRAVRSGRTERSGTTRGVQQSGAGRAACSWPAGSPPRGFRGEPAVSRSEGPCGPSERDFRSASRGRRLLPPRRADPPRLFWRRLRRGGSRWAQRGPRRADLRRAARARAALGCRRGSYRSAASCAILRAHAAPGGVAALPHGAVCPQRSGGIDRA